MTWFDGSSLLPFGRVIDIGSAVLFLLLGALVASIRPRRRANLAFAVFALTLGAAFVASNIPALAQGGLLLGPTVALYLTATLALLALGASVPAPLAAGERRGFALAVGVASAGALIAFSLAPFETEGLGGGLGAAAGYLAYGLLILAGLGGTLLVVSLRYRWSADERARSQLLLVTHALLPFFGAHVGISAVEYLGGPRAMHFWGAYTGPTGVVLLLVILGVWLATAMRGAGVPRAASRVALLGALYALLAALFASAAGPENVPRDLGPMGIARGIGIAVLSYAIVRHQLLGIQVKLRWTISRSTTAAAFIAVFFLASEGAQLFFGQENEIVGLFAAGALVFALAPLQRAADRLAERAVPVAAPAPSPSRSPMGAQEERFLAVARLAVRDRRLSREEEVALHDLADGLGIGARRAHELIVRAEREAEDGSG